MDWQTKQVNLYSTHGDRAGRVRSLRSILLSDFGDNISDICELRKLDKMHPDYEAHKRSIKNRLQCFTLNELADDRKTVIEYTGLMQLDFDTKDCEGYNIDELKRAVFDLPFIAFCGLSVSGTGFYAIAAIAEPKRQKEYAKHIFDVLADYGISCDRSKGRNYNDLRYVSYDANMLMKETVTPLRVTNFKTVTATKKQLNTNTRPTNLNSNHGALIQSQVGKILSAQIGQRWQTVQAAAFTLGGRVWRGLNESEGLSALISAIENNTAFAGQTDKYIECAKVCFNAGKAEPMQDNLKN